MTKEEIAKMIELIVLNFKEKQAKRIKEKRDYAVKENDLVGAWYNNGYLCGIETEIDDLKKIIKILRSKDNG